MRTSRCPACNAPIAPGAHECPYCQSYLVPEGEVLAGGIGEPGIDATLPGFTFERRTEPREGAFMLSVPHGWLLEGGVYRADLMHEVVSAQTIAAKVDLSVKRDAEGSVMIRWGPEMKYCDPRMMGMGGMFFPIGSNYSGMIVCPLFSATEFLIRTAFPWAHPQAEQVEIVSQQQRGELVEHHRQVAARMGAQTPFQYDGGEVVFRYSEAGRRYIEHAYTVIEAMGALAAGMWSNKNTVLMRAPDGEYESWEPVLQHILVSGEINPQWMAQEQANQGMLTGAYQNAQQGERYRAQRALDFQHEMQQMDREIVEHRQRTNAEIRNDSYLMLTGQEEYLNPYTHEVDVGSNEWRHRWVTESGDEFYSDDANDDPNKVELLKRSDWKRTAVRPRFPY